MMWGGRQANDIVGTAGTLQANTQRLDEVAGTWHGAADEIRAVADSLDRNVAGIEAGAWSGAGAETFLARYREHSERFAELEAAYRSVGTAVATVAGTMDRAHEALVLSTEAAGRTAAALAPPGDPTGAGARPAAMPVVVDAWSALASELVKNCERVVTEQRDVLDSAGQPGT